MSRIEESFARLKAEGRAAFMPFLAAGDPDLSTTRRLVAAMAGAGADLVEIGIPFSDPIADGPTIQQANERALAAGTKVRDVLGMVADLRREIEIPMLLMGSYNPVYIYGVEDFCRAAAQAGADGLILPDLPPDEAEELTGPAEAAGLDTVFLVAPTSTDERLRLAGRASRGFVYVVSLTGVTGERDRVAADLAEFLVRARQHIRLPLAVGFGISTPQMAREVGRQAEGVIIGSAIVKRIAAACEAGRDPVPDVEAFVREVAGAIRGNVRPTA